MHFFIRDPEHKAHHLDYLVRNLKGQFLVFLQDDKAVHRVHSTLAGARGGAAVGHEFRQRVQNDIRLDGVADDTCESVYQQLLTADADALGRFRTRRVKCLLTTDGVCQRGMDLDIDYVVNYTLPREQDIFLHRCGRCGRLGKPGVAVTFYSAREEVERVLGALLG